MASGPVFTYDAHIVSPGVDLNITGAGTPNISATYTDHGGVGESVSVKANCSISISYTNINYTINNDNSITVTGNISGAVLTRTFVASSSNSQEIQAWFNGHRTFYQIVSTGSSGTYDLNIPNTFSVTIPPSNNPQFQWPASIQYKNHNTGSSLPPDEFYLGLGIKNPNPPDYRPGKILNSGTWKSHNRSGGKADILRNGSWATMRTKDAPNAKNDPPTIRRSDDWYNQAKIGEGA